MLQRPEMDEIGKVLLKSADLIEERGWWNGKGPMPTRCSGSVCVMLAIAEISCGTDYGRGLTEKYAGEIDEVVSRFLKHHKVISESHKMINGSHARSGVRGLVVTWNDTHTKEEVLNALREAAYSSAIESKV